LGRVPIFSSFTEGYESSPAAIELWRVKARPAELHRECSLAV
jgi:hypothetical protein